MRKVSWKRWLLAGLVCALLTFSLTFVALGDGEDAAALEPIFQAQAEIPMFCRNSAFTEFSVQS